MMRVLAKYAGIYKAFLETSLAEGSAFRLHFILVIIMDLLFYLITFLGVDFLYRLVESVGYWNRAEFMFFLAFMLCIDHFHMTFVSENFWSFSVGLRLGQLDFTLTKPVSALFVSFFRHVRPSTLFNTPVPWAILVYYGMECGLGWRQWLALPAFFAMGMALLVILELLLSMLMFFTIESFGINYLRMQLQSLSRWPDFIYQGWLRRLLFFGFPILMVGSVPVEVMLGRASWGLALVMLATIILASLLLRWCWRKGLAAYESASS